MILTEVELRDAIHGIEQVANSRVLIYSRSKGDARQVARAILAYAENLTGGIPVNAVTHFDPPTHQITVVFRNAEVLRAEALEEARHVLQFRMGGPFVAAEATDIAFIRAFQTRELDVAVYMRNLCKEGRIDIEEYHETIRNTAGYFDMTFQEMLTHVESVS